MRCLLLGALSALKIIIYRKEKYNNFFVSYYHLREPGLYILFAKFEISVFWLLNMKVTINSINYNIIMK